LGATVKYVDKTSTQLGLTPGEKADSHIRACGFETDDGSFVYLQQNGYATDQEAVQYYSFAKDFLINMEKRGSSDYWEEDLGAVVGEGYKIHAFHADGLHFDVSGRVGKNAFTIRSNGAKSNKEFSHLKIKGFAVRIGQQLGGQ
jgi:hypothetical protein